MAELVERLRKEVRTRERELGKGLRYVDLMAEAATEIDALQRQLADAMSNLNTALDSHAEVVRQASALQRQRDAALHMIAEADRKRELGEGGGMIFTDALRAIYADAALDSQPGVQAVTDAEVKRLQEIERRTKSLQTMICEQHQVWPHGPEGLFSFILTGAAVRAEAGR